MAKTSDNMEEVLDVSSENLQQLKEEAEMIEVDILLRYIRIFSDLSNQIKYAVQKRILLEVTLIKLCKPAMETNPDTLLDRIRAVEEKVEQAGEIQVVREVAEPKREPMPKPVLEKAIPEEIKAVVKNFRSIVNETSGLLKGYLKNARLSLGGENKLLVILPDELSADFVRQEQHKRELTELIENRIGKAITIEVRQIEEGRRFEESFVDIEQVVHMDITIED